MSESTNLDQRLDLALHARHLYQALLAIYDEVRPETGRAASELKAHLTKQLTWLEVFLKNWQEIQKADLPFYLPAAEFEERAMVASYKSFLDRIAQDPHLGTREPGAIATQQQKLLA